jgi:L,D-peptidoglycan transpeptidase YkuD (ErfK/YbiS/YcfS/YnhG family)
VHDATQLVEVTAASRTSTNATLRVWVKTSSGWHLRFGPWSARIGGNGFAPPGAKREGDGRTPSGSFLLGFMFGRNGNPGVRFRYRRTLSSSYWDDDSTSARYNEWVDSRNAYPGRDPEPMRVRSYRLGEVIDYNTRRTPYKGSAIFLHVIHTGPTSGCVAIGYDDLLELVRWLRPADHPRIIMGTRSDIT